ncbi:hypothetical protein [Robbsia andropogonis]|uniref:hypothetical protein n=1 Tax=Robbsia andropogonis TaxID=28092 RepID=UPI000AEF1CA3|nr:hypothetical protein [Robbsia andropogonis]
MYGSYSALLTASGVGVDRPDRIFTELATLACLGFALAVMSDCLSVTRANGAMLDDVQA